MQLGVFNPLPTVNASAPLAKGLCAWYMTPANTPGNGVVEDITPANQHAQPISGASNYPAIPGINPAFLATDLNGSNQALKVLSNGFTTNFYSTGGMFATWLCMDSYTVQPRMFDKNQSYAAFTANNGSGLISFSLFQWFNGGSSIGIFASSSPDQYPVALGAWTHIAIAYSSASASNVPSIYVNGRAIAVSVSSTPTGSPVSDSADNLFIGSSGAFDRPFDGRMFDIRFYKGFVPDANFAKAVYLDAYNGFAGTLGYSRRHRQKKTVATSNRRRRLLCSEDN